MDNMGRIKDYIGGFKEIIKNFSYTLSYQILALILPVITVPYVTRVLNQDLVGLNSIIQANVSYFALLGMLGISLLGPREIAKCLGDKDKLTKTFFSIYKIQFVMHLLAMVLYGLYVAFFSKEKLAYFYLIYLFSHMFDISWLFFGIEDFKSIATRNLFVHLLSFASLFVFVRKDGDIYSYVLTLYVPSIFINVYMWITALRKVVYFRVKRGLDRRMMRESFSLFLPQVASSIYTVLDKTVLGLFSTYAMAAVYTQGQTLLSLTYAFASSFRCVLAPRLSSCIAKKDESDIYKYMKLSAHVISAVAWALFFGVLSCSRIFVEWYLPSGYEKTTDVLLICSPIIIMVSGANLISMEYLIPLGEQNKYTFSVVVSSIVNLILNFTLAPSMGIYGVCIGSVAAETIGFFIQLFYTRKYLNLKRVFKGTLKYFVSGLDMGLVLYLIQSHLVAELMSILLLVISGALIYSALVIVFTKISMRRS